MVNERSPCLLLHLDFRFGHMAHAAHSYSYSWSGVMEVLLFWILHEHSKYDKHLDHVHIKPGKSNNAVTPFRPHYGFHRFLKAHRPF